MKPLIPDDLYQDVPAEQREMLRSFRESHPYQRLVIGGVPWEYIASGTGQQAILILGGGISLGETSYRTILRLESQYRVISPTYPAGGKMGPVVDGLAAILDREGFAQAHVFGHSLGAAVGHTLVRMHPERVDRLALDGFGLYTASHVRMARWFFKLPYRLLLAYYRRVLDRLVTTDPEEGLFYQAYLTEVMTRLHTRETLMSQFKMLLDVFDHRGEYGVFRPVERPGKVLLILADDDRGFTPQERQALKDSYPGAQVHTFTSGGHMAGFTRREEFQGVMDRFLSGA